MLHRIMLATALVAVPAVVAAEQPAPANVHAQQVEPTKAKKHVKKGMHKKGGKTTAPKDAPSDSGKTN
jgi:hypothetical protein